VNLVRLKKGTSELPEGLVALWHASLSCDQHYVPVTSEQIERIKFWQQTLAALPTVDGEYSSIRVKIPCLVVDVVANSHYVTEEDNTYGLRQFEMAYVVKRSCVFAKITPTTVVLGAEGYEGWESMWSTYQIVDGEIVSDRERPDTAEAIEGVRYSYDYEECWPYEKLLEIADLEDTYIIHDELIGCKEELQKLEQCRPFDENDQRKYDRLQSLMPTYLERYGDRDPFQVQ
jgi:hypothetical protein